MRVYMVRHGESEGNAKRLIYGWQDYELTEKGEEDARSCAAQLATAGFERCYTSELRRAWHTAKICTEGRGVPVVRLRALNEQFMGEYEGKPFAEFLQERGEEAERMLEDWSQAVLPGGESFGGVYRRVASAAEEIRAFGRDVLVAAHNGSLSALCAHLLGLGEEGAMCFNFEHGRVSLLECPERGRPWIEYLNR